MIRDKIAEKLQRLGHLWLSALLILIALVLIYIALVDKSLTHKAIVATWVLAP